MNARFYTSLVALMAICLLMMVACDSIPPENGSKDVCADKNDDNTAGVDEPPSGTDEPPSGTDEPPSGTDEPPCVSKKMTLKWHDVPELSFDKISNLTNPISSLEEIEGWGGPSAGYTTVAKAYNLPRIWFVALQRGLVIKVDLLMDTASSFLDIRDLIPIERAFNEEGLVGLAFHPNFIENGFFFVSFFAAPGPDGFDRPWTSPRPGAKLYVSRFRYDWNKKKVLRDSRKDLLVLEKETNIHHSGTLKFGPKGMLFIAIGDDSRSRRAQDPDQLFGKILRIDVDTSVGSKNYGIPADNPFANGDQGAPEVWALGFRNPWTFEIDETSTDEISLWVGDVGPGNPGCIYHLKKGDNAGWGRSWSTRDTDQFVQAAVCSGAGDGCSIVAGTLKDDKFFYSDSCSGYIRALNLNGEPIDSVTIDDDLMVPVGMLRDENGELYAVSYLGHINRLEIKYDQSSQTAFPQKISLTSFQDLETPRVSPSNAQAYTPAQGFWSDGAEKYRWFFLPENSRIELLANGQWDFPVGTIFVKVFERNGRLLETRIIERQTKMQWRTATYVWNEEQTDAFYTAEGTTVQTNTGDWHVPDTNQCFSCHTSITGRVLGIRTAQMQEPLLDHAGKTTKDDFIERGLIEPIPANVWQEIIKNSGRIRKLDDMTASNTEKARSYLDVNCAYCHRPAGTGGGPADMRINIPLSEMNICNVALLRGEQSMSTEMKLLSPGAPSKSWIYQRMLTLETPMPPGRLYQDAAGLNVIRHWISGLSSCD